MPEFAANKKLVYKERRHGIMTKMEVYNPCAHNHIEKIKPHDYITSDSDRSSFDSSNS